MRQMARTQVMIYLRHSRLGEEANSFSAHNKNILACELLEPHAFGAQLPIGCLVLGDREHGCVKIGHG